MWWETQGYFRQGRSGYLICQENLKSKIKWTDFELVNVRVGCIIIHGQFYNNTGFGERQGTICLWGRTSDKLINQNVPAVLLMDWKKQNSIINNPLFLLKFALH